MIYKLLQPVVTVALAMTLLNCSSGFGADDTAQLQILPASDTAGLFTIPKEPPTTVITANEMSFSSSTVILTGNVRGTRENDLLTCNKAILGRDPRWMLATYTPRLFRKETLVETKLTREITLDASNILWQDAGGKISASDSVNLKVEERSWDLATYSWVFITSDEMEGFRDMNRLVFKGNVRMKDKERFGKGNHLDYLKDESMMILTGDAMIESEEWSDKEKKMVKRTVTGNRITYNTQTKEMTSE